MGKTRSMNKIDDMRLKQAYGSDNTKTRRKLFLGVDIHW
jgi:hypothetical protein